MSNLDSYAYKCGMASGLLHIVVKDARQLIKIAEGAGVSEIQLAHYRRSLDRIDEEMTKHKIGVYD